MRVIALNEDAEVIRRMPEHLALWAPQVKEQSPPLDSANLASESPLSYTTQRDTI